MVQIATKLFLPLIFSEIKTMYLKLISLHNFHSLITYVAEWLVITMHM